MPEPPGPGADSAIGEVPKPRHCRMEKESVRYRESIWSVPSSWRDAYFKLFVALVIAATVLVGWHEVARGATDGNVETFLAIARGLSPVVVVVAAWSVVSVEVGRMFSEWYLNRRYAKGLAKGLARGRAEGRTEGRAEGRAEGSARERKRWESWNRARMAAEEQGNEFSEPPPADGDEHQAGVRA